MGLLDEAIREHLDLKRRRGADPAEVERAEREALGPVRRNRDAPTADVDDDSMAGGVAYDRAIADEDWTYQDGERFADEEAPAEDPGLPPLALSGDEVRAHRSAAAAPGFDEPVPEEPAFEEPPLDDETALDERARDEPADDDDPPSAPPSRLAHGAGGGETAEYDVEEAMAGEEESGDDMLEETPEFLQDTPDHDRLWFEQRPPKDFDFDG